MYPGIQVRVPVLPWSTSRGNDTTPENEVGMPDLPPMVRYGGQLYCTHAGREAGSTRHYQYGCLVYPDCSAREARSAPLATDGRPGLPSPHG